VTVLCVPNSLGSGYTCLGRLPGKENSNSHGARPVYQIMSMIEWFRTSRLSIENSLLGRREGRARDPVLASLQMVIHARCRAHMATYKTVKAPDSNPWPLSSKHGTCKTVKTRCWQGQMQALAFRLKSSNPFKLFLLRSEAAAPAHHRCAYLVRDAEPESGHLWRVVHLGRSTCHAISGPLSDPRLAPPNLESVSERRGKISTSVEDFCMKCKAIIWP